MLCGGLAPWVTAQQSHAQADQETKARVEFYRHAISAEPSRPQLHFQMGLQLWDLGNVSEARSALLEELRLNPPNYRCRVVLGMISVQQHDYRGAIHDLEAALKTDASLTQAYYPLGQSWFHLGDFEKAREYLERASQVDPPAPTLYAMLSRAYFNLGRYDDAARMTKLYHAAGNLSLAEAAANLGSWTEADRLVSEFLDGFPHASNGLYLKAAIAFNGFRKLGEATALLEEALASDRNNLKARRLLAVLEWAGGNKEAFERDMNLVLKADPLDGQAHYYLGRYLFEQGTLALAHEHLETALRFRPSDPRVMADLARLNEALRLTPEAEESTALRSH